MRASRQRCRSSEHIAVSWLSSLLVVDHLVLEADQELLHGVLWVPVLEHVERLLNLTILLVHAWEVDLGGELDIWGNCWVAIAANDGQHVDPVVEVGVWRADDGSIPVSEGLIVTY